MIIEIFVRGGYLGNGSKVMRVIKGEFDCRWIPRGAEGGADIFEGEDLKEEGKKLADNLLQTTSRLFDITLFLMMGRTSCLLNCVHASGNKHWHSYWLLDLGSLASVRPTPIPPRPPTTVALIS